MNAQEPLEDEKPLDPETEKVGRKLKRFGAIFMGLNMLALMAVLGAIVYKLSGNSEEPQTASGDLPVPSIDQINGEMDLPDDAEVLSASHDGGRILLNLKLGDGSRALWFYDLNERRVIGKLAIR